MMYIEPSLIKRGDSQMLSRYPGTVRSLPIWEAELLQKNYTWQTGWGDTGLFKNRPMSLIPSILNLLFIMLTYHSGAGWTPLFSDIYFIVVVFFSPKPFVLSTITCFAFLCQILGCIYRSIKTIFLTFQKI